MSIVSKQSARVSEIEMRPQHPQELGGDHVFEAFKGDINNQLTTNK